MVENDLQGVAVDTNDRWFPPDHRLNFLKEEVKAREGGASEKDG